MSFSDERILEIAARRIQDGRVRARFDVPADPDAFDFDAAEGSRDVGDMFPKLADFLGDSVVVVYGSSRKVRALDRSLMLCGEDGIENSLLFVDRVARRFLPETKAGSLEEMAAALGIPCDETRRASRDVDVVVEILHSLIERASSQGISSVEELLEYQYPEAIPVDFTRYAFDRDDLRALPETPGVYLMRDRSGNVIYVGKSKNLRSRVRSYFTAASRLPVPCTARGAGRMERVERILNAVYDITYEVVGSELEALLLEHRLIRTYDPEINRQMEVHERPEDRPPRRNLMVLLPSCSEGCVELFLVRGDVPAHQIRLRRGDDDLGDLRSVIRRTYFPDRTAGAADGHKDLGQGGAEAEIVRRWLSGKLDEVNYVDIDAVADLDDAIRLLREYLKHVGGEKVYYV